MHAALLIAVALGCSKSAAAGSSTSSGSSDKSKIEANLTDLPTYPNLTSGSMLGHPPKQGAVYNATTNDADPKYPGVSIALGQDAHQ